MSEPSLLNKAPEVASRKQLEGGQKFVLNRPFAPAGAQPTAISELVHGLHAGEPNQLLL